MSDSPYPIWRVLQYPVGLIFAFPISIFSALVLVPSGIPLLLMHLLVGFFGVFLASFCFMRDSRVAGSIFLAIAGAGFFYVRFVLFWFEPDPLTDVWMRLAFICLGAIVAVMGHAVWYFVVRRDRK